MIHTPNQDESQNHAPGNPRDSGFWRDALKGKHDIKKRPGGPGRFLYGISRFPKDQAVIIADQSAIPRGDFRDQIHHRCVA